MPKVRTARCCAGFFVSSQHSGVVHTVDMVAGENEYVVGVEALNKRDVLVDGIGGAFIPLGLLAAGIGGQNLGAAVGLIEPPGLAVADVLVQFQGLILGENSHRVNPGIDAIGQGKINDAVLTAKGNGRLGGVFRQNLQPAALASGQEHGNTAFLLKIHESPLLTISN